MSNIKTLVNNIKINILLDDNFWKQYLDLNDSQILTYVESKTEEELGMIINEFVIGMVSGLHFDTYRKDLFTKLWLAGKFDGIMNARKILIDREILNFNEDERFNMISYLIDEMYDGISTVDYKNILICDFIKSPNYFLTDDDWYNENISVDSVGYTGWDEEQDMYEDEYEIRRLNSLYQQ